MGRRGRGRGRPASTPSSADHSGQGAAGKATSSRIYTYKFPVTARDDEIVECSDCTAFRDTLAKFRLHNIEIHYNLATTKDDSETVRDHKFYSKRLKELSKLTKITTYVCPRLHCVSKYKSALGLSYHLETCGKTREEAYACMIQCDVCMKKFTLPNLAWHRKTHQQPSGVAEDLEESTGSSSQSAAAGSRSPRKKRQSAMKACEFIGRQSGGDSNSSSPSKSRRQAKDDEDSDDSEFITAELTREDWVFEPSLDNLWDESTAGDFIEATGKRTIQPPTTRPDIGNKAMKYLERTTGEPNVWDTPDRNLKDPFTKDVFAAENPLEDIECSRLKRLYLPGMEQSFEFKTKASIKSESFDGQRAQIPALTKYHRLAWFESEIIDSVDRNFVTFTGGPITSMAWHPSGDYLAVSTMKHYMETPDLVADGRRRTSIQIYTHISCTESEILDSSPGSPSVAFNLSLIVGLDYGHVNHLQWGNFWPHSCDPFFNDNGGPVTKEESRVGYICCAFEDSTCRIFALQRGDLFDKVPNFVATESCKLRVYRKVPEIVLCIPDGAKQSTGQCTRFDWHEGNRFLVSGYASGLVAVFNLETTSKLLRTHGKDGDSPVIIFYPFWMFRAHKWPITGVHIDPGNPRYFHTASMDRFLKAWDVELRQEIESKRIGFIIDTCWIRGWVHVAASTDLAVSNLSSAFNFARFYQLGSSTGRPNCFEYYNITSIAFYEGMTAQGTENGRVTVTYFDSFWRDCDFERNKRKKNAVHVSNVELDEDSVTPLSGDWLEDRSRRSEGEPRLILSFVKERVQSQVQMQPEPSRQYGENLIRYYHFLRINKVAWCPSGKYLAVGYRNGLLTIIPASFDALYT